MQMYYMPISCAIENYPWDTATIANFPETNGNYLIVGYATNTKNPDYKISLLYYGHACDLELNSAGHINIPVPDYLPAWPLSMMQTIFCYAVPETCSVIEAFEIVKSSLVAPISDR
jgi:hypothetical protein